MHALIRPLVLFVIGDSREQGFLVSTGNYLLAVCDFDMIDLVKIYALLHHYEWYRQ